jgi:hypothetical protein
VQKWSHNLDVDVRTCARRVFLKSRFAMHSCAKGSPRHEGFLLKQALDIPNWRGRLVHKVIHDWVVPVLKRGKWPDFKVVRAEARALVDRQSVFSSAQKYRSLSISGSNGDYCVLRTDLLSDGLSEQQIEGVAAEVELALKVLEQYHVKLLERAQHARWVDSEKEIRFQLDEEIRIEAIPDLLFCETTNRGVIVDWKVWDGTKGTARDQLHAYAFAVLRSNWWKELRVDNLELVEANLITGDAVYYDVTENDLDAVDDRIFVGVERLRPIFERSVAECAQEDFAPADSPGACLYCPVKEICNGSYASTATTQLVQPKLF